VRMGAVGEVDVDGTSTLAALRSFLQRVIAEAAQHASVEQRTVVSVGNVEHGLRCRGLVTNDF
jgi:hypothetical protein